MLIDMGIVINDLIMLFIGFGTGIVFTYKLLKRANKSRK